jgi:hypothetical protein
MQLGSGSLFALDPAALRQWISTPVLGRLTQQAISSGKGGNVIIAGLYLRLRSKHWRRQRQRRQLIGGDPDEARAAIVASWVRFQDIIAGGGYLISYFASEENRETSLRLNELADRADDDSLSTLLLEAAGAWEDAWSHAPPSKRARVATYSLDELRTEIEERRARQVECARSGAEWCEEALTRLNEIDRTL